MICVIWSIHRLSLGLLWRNSRPGKVARSTATGTEPSLKYCTFFRCNPSDTNLSTCAQWLGREDVRCSTLVPRSHMVKKTDANSYTRLISKYFVARCRKPQSLKMKNRQKITRTSQGLLSFYSWRSLHTWKDGLLLRQASSLVSFFFGVREISCVQVRAKAEFDLRFAFACFYLLLYHKRKSCPTKPDYAGYARKRKRVYTSQKNRESKNFINFLSVKLYFLSQKLLYFWFSFAVCLCLFKWAIWILWS